MWFIKTVVALSICSSLVSAMPTPIERSVVDLKREEVIQRYDDSIELEARKKKGNDVTIALGGKKGANINLNGAVGPSGLVAGILSPTGIVGQLLSPTGILGGVAGPQESGGVLGVVPALVEGLLGNGGTTTGGILDLGSGGGLLGGLGLKRDEVEPRFAEEPVELEARKKKGNDVTVGLGGKKGLNLNLNGVAGPSGLVAEILAPSGVIGQLLSPTGILGGVTGPQASGGVTGLVPELLDGLLGAGNSGGLLGGTTNTGGLLGGIL